MWPGPLGTLSLSEFWGLLGGPAAPHNDKNTMVVWDEGGRRRGKKPSLTRHHLLAPVDSGRSNREGLRKGVVRIWLPVRTLSLSAPPDQQLTGPANSTSRRTAILSESTVVAQQSGLQRTVIPVANALPPCLLPLCFILHDPTSLDRKNSRVCIIEEVLWTHIPADFQGSFEWTSMVKNFGQVLEALDKTSISVRTSSTQSRRRP